MIRATFFFSLWLLPHLSFAQTDCIDTDLYSCIPQSVQADATGPSPLQRGESFLDIFERCMLIWREILTNEISRVVWLLGVISLVWTAIMIAIRGGDFAEMVFELTRFLITVSVMWWCLLNGPDLARIMIQLFIDLGSLVSSDLSVQ